MFDTESESETNTDKSLKVVGSEKAGKEVTEEAKNEGLDDPKSGGKGEGMKDISGSGGGVLSDNGSKGLSEGKGQVLEVDLESFYSYPEELKEIMETSDQLSKKIALNSALLEKLKTELISHKMKYADNQMLLADINNESSKLKKKVEVSEVNFGSIIPNLIYVILEKKNKEPGSEEESNIKTLQTFQELRTHITQGIENGENMKLEIHFIEDKNLNKGSLKEQKTRFKLGFATFNKLFSKVKEVNTLTLYELKKKPQLLEPNKMNRQFLQKQVIDVSPIDRKIARSKAKVYTTHKYYPDDMRPELWSSTIRNPANINLKWYSEYLKVLKKNENFGSTDIISSKIDHAFAKLVIPEDKKLKNSVTNILLIFELSQPDVGYVIGMEKVAIFLRRLCEEFESFLIFYNCIFSFKFIWAIYSQNHVEIQVYLKAFDLMSQRFPETENAYKMNKIHINRFFVEQASTLFLDVFEESNVERMMDQLTSKGEFVFFVLMFMVAEGFSNLDVSSMHYDVVKKMMVEKARKIDAVGFYYRLMNCGSEKKIFKGIVERIRKENQIEEPF